MRRTSETTEKARAQPGPCSHTLGATDRDRDAALRSPARAWGICRAEGRKIMSRKGTALLSRRVRYGREALMTLALLFLSFDATPAELHSYALVQDDGTLKIRNRIVHLYGVYLPPTGFTCQSNFDPVRCGSRAALALRLKIGSRFVRCEIVHKNPDRSVSAVCSVKGEDLATYLLQLGWAVATPDAPFEYVVLERIARSQQVGVWGFPVDQVIR